MMTVHLSIFFSSFLVLYFELFIRIIENAIFVRKSIQQSFYECRSLKGIRNLIYNQISNLYLYKIIDKLQL